MHHSKLHIAKNIESITSDADFDKMAKEMDTLQTQLVPEFAKYKMALGDKADRFPLFLPIEAFKHHKIVSELPHNVLFQSSGTTQSGLRSKHYVYDEEMYSQLSRAAFERLYSSLEDWTILALLPNYVENGDSSLVYMVKEFIEHSKTGYSRFISDEGQLEQSLNSQEKNDQKTLLIGTSYALLDYAKSHTHHSSKLVVMETGGMKGRKKEMTRAALHEELSKAFPKSKINSEYGMTELLSQAYSTDGTWFCPPPWMRAYVTEINDPLNVLPNGKRGLLAIVDLANLHSCAFIQTRDIGIINDKGHFTVEGRLDNSDIRGCNLLHA